MTEYEEIRSKVVAIGEMPCFIVDTYEIGPKVNTSPLLDVNMTKHQLHVICEELSEIFGYSVVPEKITEGGLLFQDHLGYKSLK
jgi:hypothetical protein